TGTSACARSCSARSPSRCASRRCSAAFACARTRATRSSGARCSGIASTLARSIYKTAAKGMARVIVADDASGPEHVAALRRIEGIDELIVGEQNAGFAANVNRGLLATAEDRDVVVLNSDTEALPSWLECLQY